MMTSAIVEKSATQPVPLLRIMYSSVLQKTLTDQSLQSLLDQCISRNERDDITGVLMVNGKLCVQYIEGCEEPMLALWERISHDSRHHLIVQLYEESGATNRLFGRWAMLHGQASRAEMLGLIRKAYVQSEANPRPAWSLAMAPLVILLDDNYRHAYAEAAA